MAEFEFKSDAEIAAMTLQERYDYRERQKDFWDYYSVIETAEHKGIAKGRAEGIVDMAKIMKGDGMSIQLITKYTGLPHDIIESL